MTIVPCVSQSDLVRQKLSEQSEIRPFPAAVTQLLAAFQDPNSTSEKYAKIIECDPGLAMRTLRMANSPMYGSSNEIRSIAHATSILGTRVLKSLAMLSAGAAMFSNGSTAADEREELWKHSLGTGSVARVLAEYHPSLTPDDAFLGGVFHDVGKLFLYDIVPKEYATMNSTYVGTNLTQQEQLAFEVTHEEIGLKFATSWNLAENLKVAIGYHHRPSEAPAHDELATVVHQANELARAWSIGSTGEEDLKCLDFNEETLVTVRERAEAAFVDVQGVCV